MKRILVSLAIIITTIVTTSYAFAEATVKPARTHTRWNGSLSDIWPGSNLIITGAGGDVVIPEGNLGLKENGTFDSTEIRLESHRYNPWTKIIDVETTAVWALDKLDFEWGANNVGDARVKVFNTLSEEPNIALKIDEKIKDTSRMSLKVENLIPFDVTDIVDPTADARVSVTMMAELDL